MGHDLMLHFLSCVYHFANEWSSLNIFDNNSRFRLQRSKEQKSLRPNESRACQNRVPPAPEPPVADAPVLLEPSAKLPTPPRALS